MINLWSVLLGVFVIAHIWLMFKGHGKHQVTDGKEKDEHKHGGCCH